MKGLKKTLVMSELVAVLAILSFLLPAPARAGGASLCELGVSTGTTIVQCARNNGTYQDLTLYRIDFDSAPLGAFVVCFDSAPVDASGTAISPSGLNINNDGVYATSAWRVGFTSSTAAGNNGNFPSNMPPTNAANGLACGLSCTQCRASVRFKKQ